MGKLKTFIFLALLFLVGSCAQQRAPTGGYKDIIAPQIIKATPMPMTTRFTSSRIEIEFDEYVQLQGVRDQVLISPPLSKNPVIQLKGGKRLLIDFGDESLRENTTYTINFGEAIKDNNEGNPLKENVYLFSTGDFIDTLFVQGQILKARYNSPCDGCMAMLFPDVADSLVIGKRPFYVARADIDGYFQINNLAAGEYRLFALEDLDADLKIDANEAMAFMDDLISPMAMDSTLKRIRLFSPASNFVGIRDQEWSKDGRSLILVTRGLDSIPRVPSALKDRLLYIEKIEEKVDSVRYWFDTSLEDLDELILDMQGLIDTISTGRAKDIAPMTSLELALELPYSAAPLSVNLSRPFAELNKQLIVIEKDSLPVDWTLSDSTIPAMKFEVNAAWEEGAFYDVFIPKGAVVDIYGKSNDSLVTRVRCPENRTFGTLTLDILLPESDFPVYLEVLDKSRRLIVRRESKKSLKWTISYLKPGEYSLRAFVDEDMNGIWSSGDFELSKQPEPVYMLPEPIAVRANWELEQEIQVQFH